METKFFTTKLYRFYQKWFHFREKILIQESNSIYVGTEQFDTIKINVLNV